MNKIIINADDFGISKDINLSILSAFEKNLITSSTLIANMESFDDAVRIINEKKLHGRIGIHLNLSQGKPLSEKIKYVGEFVNTEGDLNFKRNVLYTLNKKQEIAVFDEFESQILRLIEHGVHPTHIDSHHHVHTEWDIGRVVIKLAKKHNIYSIRLSRNAGNGISKFKKLYKYFYNTRLRLNNFKQVDYFGDYQDLLNSNLSGDLELMVHPKFLDNKLVDLDFKNLEIVIDDILKKYKNHYLSSY